MEIAGPLFLVCRETKGTVALSHCQARVMLGFVAPIAVALGLRAVDRSFLRTRTRWQCAAGAVDRNTHGSGLRTVGRELNSTALLLWDDLSYIEDFVLADLSPER